MLVKKSISETKNFKSNETLMESQIELFLDGFANDVIKVLSNQTVPLKN